MKFVAMLGLAASMIAAAFTVTPAQAQQTRIYKYCLVQGSFGGWGSTLCRFDTIQQCRMSMNGPWDRCEPNVYKQKA